MQLILSFHQGGRVLVMALDEHVHLDTGYLGEDW